MKKYRWNKLTFADQEQLMQRPALVDDSQLLSRVEEIVELVRVEGDSALRSLTMEFDQVELKSFEVTSEELSNSYKKLAKTTKNAIVAAAKNIEYFHRDQVPKSISRDTAPGVRCERVIRPIQNIGLYVPGGDSPLLSTALMLAIPAALAECPTTILCSPPNKNGKIDAEILFVAQKYGIKKIFKLGGAQAIAAMAYGTQTVPKVNKIFGPGNRWVAAAKAHVSRDPSGAAQDLPAGPSELLVIADGEANPSFVAADLLSQAEHSPDSQVILITSSESLADSVENQVAHQKNKLARQAIIEEALSHSYTLTVTNLEMAIDIANRYAPEHLILQTQHPRKLLDQITTAGSVFLGPWAAEAVGDYCSGTNHVLPTYGLARGYSGLGVNDFVRTMTVQELNRDGIATLGPLAETLAKLEGLDAHGAAVTQRLKVLNEMGA